MVRGRKFTCLRAGWRSERAPLRCRQNQVLLLGCLSVAVSADGGGGNKVVVCKRCLIALFLQYCAVELSGTVEYFSERRLTDGRGRYNVQFSIFSSPWTAHLRKCMCRTRVL